MQVVEHRRFVYDQIVTVPTHSDLAVSRIAAAIGEPARARMLCCLMDGHARTSTELAVVAEVSPSTASVHLNRLNTAHLVKVLVQGKYRYYSLAGPNVAVALEALQVAAGGDCGRFVPKTPTGLRAARTCYDHMAGTVAVLLHDRFFEMEWLTGSSGESTAYHLTEVGADAIESLGIPIEATMGLRRRFAFACLDWSERRPHLGGALGAALLTLALRKRWVVQDLDGRALEVTRAGKQEMHRRFRIQLTAA